MHKTVEKDSRHGHVVATIGFARHDLSQPGCAPTPWEGTRRKGLKKCLPCDMWRRFSRDCDKAISPISYIIKCISIYARNRKYTYPMLEPNMSTVAKWIWTWNGNAKFKYLQILVDYCKSLPSWHWHPPYRCQQLTWPHPHCHAWQPSVRRSGKHKSL